MTQPSIWFFFPLLIPIIIVVVFFVVLISSNEKKWESLRKLSGYFDGRVSKISLFPAFAGQYQGLKFSIVLVPESRDSPPYLKIILFKNHFFKLKIYREGFLSRLGEKIGIVHEVKTNGEVFDREFLIFSDQPAQAISYLNNAGRKEIINGLFNDNFYAILIDGNKILIRKPNYDPESELNPERVKETLRKLSSF